MLLVVFGALVSLASAYFSNPPGHARPEEKARYRLFVIMFALVGGSLTVVGAFRNQAEKREAKQQADRTLADEKLRAEVAENHVRELNETLTRLRIDLGVDQVDYAKQICPKPAVTLSGDEHGRLYDVWRYMPNVNLEIWFERPGGRYAFSQNDKRRLTSREASRLLPCIASLISLPKQLSRAPQITEQIIQQPSAATDDHTALYWLLGISVIAILVLRKHKT